MLQLKNRILRRLHNYMEQPDKKIKKEQRIRGIACLLLFAILAASTVALILGSTGSKSYLFDETSVSVNYSVAQLKFDLSSNHMYTYYSDNPDYVSLDQNEETFSTMLAHLVTLKGRVSSNNLSLAAYTTQAMDTMKTFYPAEMIDALQTTYSTYASDSVEYGTRIRQIYNTYSSMVEFPFKIKDIDLSAIDPAYGVWYYYTEDLEKLYNQEYVVQKNAGGTTSSTIAVAVKLKGGTTFSADETGEYYDNNFNEMVKPLTLKLVNTGNANMYVAFSLTLNEQLNQGKGITGIVLPKDLNINEITAANETYGTSVNNGVIQWRTFIILLLKNAKTAGHISFGYTDAQLEDLSYSDLCTLIRSFNQWSLTTYYDTEVKENLKLRFPGNTEQNAGLEDLRCGMLFFADYETCMAQYNLVYPEKNATNDNWGMDDDYLLNKYNFTINIRSSLRDLDMTDPALDWTAKNNVSQDYEKYAGVSNFDVEGFGYFLQSNGTKDPAKNHMSDGYIICNYTNPNASNYIGKFRLCVNYRGFSPAYIRVRFIEQFTNSAGEIVAVNQLKFKQADNWVDNRLNDLYFYSAKQYYSLEKDIMTTTGKAKLISIPVLDGLSEDYYTGQTLDLTKIDETLVTNPYLELKLSIYIEAVQPNRIGEFFGIEENQIPATDAVLE